MTFVPKVSKIDNFLKVSISIHGSVLLIMQRHCKTPLKRRRIIPIHIKHFEVKTLQTLIKSFIIKKALQCQINQLTDVERDFLF